jgi:hypothetical protein
MSIVITITVTDTIPHTTQKVEQQTAFTYEQHKANDKLAHSAVHVLCLRVAKVIGDATGPGVLCSDGVLRIRKR